MKNLICWGNKITRTCGNRLLDLLPVELAAQSSFVLHAAACDRFISSPSIMPMMIILRLLIASPVPASLPGSSCGSLVQLHCAFFCMWYNSLKPPCCVLPLLYFPLHPFRCASTFPLCMTLFHLHMVRSCTIANRIGSCYSSLVQLCLACLSFRVCKVRCHGFLVVQRLFVLERVPL